MAESLDKRTQFRHGQQTSQDIDEIVEYLQDEMPGINITEAHAIRFAIAKTADRIRVEMTIRMDEAMDHQELMAELNGQTKEELEQVQTAVNNLLAE